MCRRRRPVVNVKTRRAPTSARTAPSAAIKAFVHVMQERCIGCKNLRRGLPVWGDGSGGAPGRSPQRRRVERHGGKKAEANKCDLCHQRDSGPACIEACPTHALVCVDRNKLEQMNLEKNVAVRRWPGNTPHERGANPHTRQSAGGGFPPLCLATGAANGARRRCL